MYIGPPKTQKERKLIMMKTLAALGSQNEGDESTDISLVLEEISAHSHCVKLSAADLKSVVTSAYLAAANDQLAMVERGKEVEMENASEAHRTCSLSINVTEKNLWNAFISTRPSVNEEERQFYDAINSPLRKTNGKGK